MRCRLVGRDFKVKGVEEREDLFAAMPPLEAKKLMFRMVAAVRGQRRRRGLEEVKLMFIDVKKAHLYARCEEEEWVQLPEEFWEYGKYARLRRWLYGMRKAAAEWEEEYAGKLESEGFRRGKGAPTVFFNTKTTVRLVVHGDDFTYSGTKKELEKIKEKMREWYVIKDRGTMGSGKNEIKEVTILGRTVRWTAEGLEYEADVGRRRRIMEAEGLEEDSKSGAQPCGEGRQWQGRVGREGLRHGLPPKIQKCGSDVELLGPGQERHPVRCEGNLSGNVEADGGRQGEDQESCQVLDRSEEVGVEVPGDGGRRREGEGGRVRGLRLGEWMVSKVHEWRDVDRERCRSKALEQDPKGQSIEFWRGRVLRDGDGVR